VAQPGAAPGPDGGATAKAIDYTLGHWAALTRHLKDGAVAIDNNHLERQIKPWAMGRRHGSSWAANSPASARPS
jgi:hypothetical protein